MMTALCPSPHNELGKGIFSPEKEAQLLDKGYVFACRIKTKNVSGLVRCKRPVADAIRDMEMDDPYASGYSYRPVSNPVAAPLVSA